MALKPHHRLIIATVACIVLSAGVFVVKRGYSFTVIPPQVRLADAPKQVDDWRGEIAELTDAEFGVLNASDVASLRFIDPAGRTAFMHVATWTDPDEVAETCPHHPAVCYSGNGWSRVAVRRVKLPVDGSGDVPIEINLMDRGGEKVVIAFTYSMGDLRFATDYDARLAQTKLWGQREWPAVTKYLVQVNTSEIDQALPTIEQLLTHFIRWHDAADAVAAFVAPPQPRRVSLRFPSLLASRFNRSSNRPGSPRPAEVAEFIGGNRGAVQDDSCGSRSVPTQWFPQEPPTAKQLQILIGSRWPHPATSATASRSVRSTLHLSPLAVGA